MEIDPAVTVHVGVLAQEKVVNNFIDVCEYAAGMAEFTEASNLALDDTRNCQCWMASRHAFEISQILEYLWRFKFLRKVR